MTKSSTREQGIGVGKSDTEMTQTLYYGQFEDTDVRHIHNFGYHDAYIVSDNKN